MAVEFPKIDKRNFEEMLLEFQALVPFYTPEWHLEAEGKSADLALVKIFIHMLEIIIRQLNRLPEKHFTAFLDRIGTRLLPVRPASVPITFSLSEGAEHILIPASTQVAAGEVIFETEKNILAAPARLVQIYCVDGQKDAILGSPPNIISGEPVLPFATRLLYDAKQGDKEIYVESSEDLQEGDIILIGGMEYAVVSEVSGAKVVLLHELEKCYPGYLSLPAVAVSGVGVVFSGRLAKANILTIKDLLKYKDKVEELAVILKNGEQSEEYYREQAENILENAAKYILDEAYEDMVSTNAAQLILFYDLVEEYPFYLGLPSRIVRGVDKDFALRLSQAGIKTVKDLLDYEERVEELAVILKNGEQSEEYYREQAENILENAAKYILDEDHEQIVSSAVAAGSVLPLLTAYYPAGCSLQKVIRLAPGKGKNLQEHRLFLGHAGLSEIEDKSKITLDIDTKFSDLSLVSWEYYGEDSEGICDWFHLEIDTAASSQAGQVVLLKNVSGEITEFEIYGVTSSWLRCTVHPAKISELKDTLIDTVTAAIEPQQQLVGASGILPDLLFYNDVPGDPANLSEDNPFYSFGEIPRQYDTFYIASQEVFSQKRVAVTIGFKFSQPGFPGEKGVTLSWEYWNGQGWNIIKTLDDRTVNFTKDEAVTFDCPEDIEPMSVNGIENYWLRVRLVMGDYGQEKFLKTTEGGGTDETVVWRLDRSEIHPPKIKSLSLSYQYTLEFPTVSLTLDRCLVYNNLEYSDRSKEINEAGKTFKPFPPLEEDQRYLYLAFDGQLQKGPISIYFAVEEQPISSDRVPTLNWQYYSTSNRWERLDVLDDTHGLTRSGVMEFFFPPDFKETKKFAVTAYFIRARCEKVESTVIQGLFLNTALAIQCETVKEEILGSSNGSSDQVFSIERIPLISEDIWVNEITTISAEERLQIQEEKQYQVKEVKDEKEEDVTEFWVRWQSVDDLLNSGGAQRHYEIDRVFGKVIFGDGIHGKIPPTGTDNIKADYRSGGGRKGNLPPFEVTEMKSSIPFLESAFNPLTAGGGTDRETSDSILQRGSQVLKHRNRVVTVEDFEQLTRQYSGDIARVKCLPNSKAPGEPASGWVTVIVIPQSLEERPLLHLMLKQRVQHYLQDRAVNILTAKNRLQVAGPVYVEVSVSAELVAVSGDVCPLVEKRSQDRLREFLNPLSGGFYQKGWEFGRMPYLSDFYALLEKIAGVDHVEKLSLKLRTLEDDQPSPVLQPETREEEEFHMPPYGVVCSGTHEITVRF